MSERLAKRGGSCDHPAMPAAKSNLKNTIELILSQPTSPFRESWVKQACRFFCAERLIPAFEDDFGNLWIGVSSRAQAARAELVFVAHMDHPGFVVERFERRAGRVYARATWLGGGPKNIVGFPVQVFSDVSAVMVFDGIVRSQSGGPRGPEKAVIEILARKVSSFGQARGLGRDLMERACTPSGFKSLGPWGACLWYARAGISQGVALQNGKWVTKAADDLIGVCAILEGYACARKTGRHARHANGAREKNIAVLLTRAEESGFHGAISVLEKRILNPRKTLVVSVETSSRLAGAMPGLGPVVRLGDRGSVFDPALARWIESRAAALAKRDSKVRVQTKLMDGGTCEATALNCYGFRVAGISTPLENYHNQFLPARALTGKVKTSAPRGPHPERVDASDVEKLALFIECLIGDFEHGLIRNLSREAFAPLKLAILRHYRAETAKYA